jgi:aspartyl-tRNA(Asn)/glutamyl-tRNA(Gln) amidotransferase subunit C
MVQISREEVLHVARLARLALTDEEVERFRDQLSAILEAVGKVSELDLEGVPPTSHPLDLVNVLAADEPRASLSREDALANAPDPEDGFFGVPPV